MAVVPFNPMGRPRCSAETVAVGCLTAGLGKIEGSADTRPRRSSVTGRREVLVTRGRGFMMKKGWRITWPPAKPTEHLSRWGFSRVRITVQVFRIGDSAAGRGDSKAEWPGHGPKGSSARGRAGVGGVAFWGKTGGGLPAGKGWPARCIIRDPDHPLGADSDGKL